MTRATLLRGFRAARCGDRGHPHPLLGRRGGPAARPRARARGAAYNFTELAPLPRAPPARADPGPAGPRRDRGATGASRASATWRRTSRSSPKHEGMAPAAVLGYSMGGVVALRLAAERPEAVTALVLLASAGIVSHDPRARSSGSAATTALRPARLVAHARDAIACRPDLRAAVFGYWGAEDPRSLSPEAVIGFLEAQPEHTDVEERCAGAPSRRSARLPRPRPLPGARRLGRPRPAHPARGRLRVRPAARRAAQGPPGDRAPGGRRVPARMPGARARLARTRFRMTPRRRGAMVVPRQGRRERS